VKRPIYQSVAINDVTVRHWPHDHVVNLLRRCRTRRFASLTLMTSRDNDARRDPPPPARRAAAAIAPVRRFSSYDYFPRFSYNSLVWPIA